MSQEQEEKETTSKGKKTEEKKLVPAPKVISVDDKFLDRIQAKLSSSNTDELKKINTVIEAANIKAAGVKDFEAYFRPLTEKRSVTYNELAKNNSFDIPININAGNVRKPASFTKTITLNYNDASKEQMLEIETLRGKVSDLERVDRVASSLSVSEMDKKGIKLPVNFATVSAECSRAKEELLELRIIVNCGVDEDTAKDIARIAHSQTLDSILDAWEYRNRTGFPNSNPDNTPNSSQSGYQ
jgi:hypothetical protein